MVWTALVLLAISGKPTTGDPAAPVAFNRDIRPILSDHCYPCHGPDPAKRKADLRLDLESSARADRDGRRAIIPGDWAASELYRRITAEDPDERMPPPKSGKVLSPAQIETIRRWIAEGAKWQPHWAFIPPQRPPIPRVERMGWVRNPIDAFVLARLEREGLAPSPEAERATLLRRVTLDLTGLPPTPAEVDAFLTRPRTGRLRAGRRSPAGLAPLRRADGGPLARRRPLRRHQRLSDRRRPRIMWRWRDWVIDAFNRNLPFDRFTIEQLAGDLLPGATLDQQIATGFNRNHRGNAEGGIIPEEYAVEYVVDRVETTATVWLGLTLGCARCHDHKFDPVTQKEFYRLFAFFNNVPENGRAVKYGNSPPFIKAPTRAQQQELDRLRQPRSPRLERDWQAPRAGDRVGADPPGSRRSVNARRSTGSPTEHRIFPIRAFTRHRRSHPSARQPVDAGDVGAVRLLRQVHARRLDQAGRPAGGTILSRMSDEPQGDGYSVVLDRGKVQVNLVKRWLDDALRVETKATVAADRWTHVAVTYDGSRVADGVQVYVDGDSAPMTVLLDELNQTFETKEPLRIGAGGGREARFHGAIDDVRSTTRAFGPEAIAILATPESITKIAALSPGEPDARPGGEAPPVLPGERGPRGDPAAGGRDRRRAEPSSMR